MMHFKDVVRKVKGVMLKKTLLTLLVVFITSFALRFIVFVNISKNVKADFENNEQTFSVSPEYQNLNYNYKLVKNNDKLNEDYLDSFIIYKKEMLDPKNKFEEAISYNLNYLDSLSNGRKKMTKELEKTNKDFTVSSFFKEKEKYNLNISESDKEKLNKNSKYIREHSNNIKDVKDRNTLLSSLDTLDYLLNLETKDEVLSLTDMYDDTGVDYFLTYLNSFVQFFMILLLVLILITI